ncbi:MAG TPA: hypothetical protein VKI64_01545 [Acidimicrobiales bacterium]|nr:hypothetical protein [Acidimicrobiales bacterium]
MRQLAAVLAGAAVAALGALIVGEYELRGATPVVAGLLFGLVVAEVLLAVGRASNARAAVSGALLSAGGLVWAALISVRNRGTGFPVGGWVAAALGAVTAAVWIRSSGRRGARSRRGP